MKLTPFGKLFIALVALAVIGFVVFKKYGDQLREWSGAGKVDSKKPDGTGGGNDVTKDDFANLNNGITDAPRNGGVPVNGGANVGSQTLSRPLKVGINTWAATRRAPSASHRTPGAQRGRQARPGVAMCSRSATAVDVVRRAWSQFYCKFARVPG